MLSTAKLMHKISIFGHRGSPEEFPENTLASFQRALELGADGVELDIHKTLDGQLVVIHNAEFFVENRGTQYIFDYTYPELKKIFPELPLLQEVIDLCKNRAKIEIEIKREDKETVGLCVEAIVRNNLHSDVEVISFHPTVLQEIKSHRADIATGLIFDTFPDWMQAKHREVTVLDALNFINADVAHIKIDELDETLVAAIKKGGRKVQASRVDTIELMKKAFSLRVDQITTDRPKLAVDHLVKEPLN